MLKQQNESYLSYLKRVIQATREKRITYDQMGDYLLGSDNDYCSDNLRKAYYVLDRICDKLEDDIVITDVETEQRIKQQMDELFKETVKVRDQKRENRNILREMARYEHLQDVLFEELDKTEPYKIIKHIEYEPNNNTEAIVMISDIHYGMKVHNAVNEYNTSIAKECLNNLAYQVVDYCKLYKVRTLNVELLGDLVSGTIHVSNRVEQEEDIISQVIQISNILVSVIRYFVENIPNVNVYGVFGNHSRVTANKQDHINRENYERLIFSMIEHQVTGINKFETSGTDDFLIYEMNNGRTILCTHGDKDNRGSLVNNYVNLLGKIPNEIHIGHWHSYKIEDNNGIEIVTNGSIIGADDYAISLRKNTPRSQVLRIYDRDICSYNITL